MYSTLLELALGVAAANQVTGVSCPDLDSQRGVLLQANCVGPTGGTSIDAYVQTSADGGETWYDVANFHFTTSAGIKAFNLSSKTPVTSQAALASASLSANTALDGLLGDRLRVLWTSVGTYTGGSLTVSAIAR